MPTIERPGSAGTFSPTINTNLSYSAATSADGAEAKKFNSVIRPEVYGPATGSPNVRVVVNTEYGRSLGLNDSEILEVSNSLNLIGTISYYDFVSNASSMSQGQKLLLLASLNRLLYQYAYDEEMGSGNPLGSPDKINDIDSKGYDALKTILGSLAGNASVPDLDFGICGGIALFTARLAEEMGMDAYVVNGYKHAIAIINTKSDGFIFIDSGVLATGTNNFNRAMTMYMGYKGQVVTQTRIVDTDGKFLAQIPTNEGAFISGLGGYYTDGRDVVRNSAEYMAMDSLPGGFSTANGPSFSLDMGLSPDGTPNIAGISAQYALSDSHSISGKFYGFGGDGYDLGAIQRGYLGDISYSYREHSKGKFFEFTGGLTGSDLEVYNFSEGEDATANNNINALHMNMTALWENPIGAGKLRYGLIENSVITYVNAPGDGYDLLPSFTLAPQVSYFLPRANDGNMYFGLSAPIQVARTNSQSDRDEFAAQPGLGLAAGARFGLGSGTMDLNAVGQTGMLSDNLDLNIGFDGYLGNVAPSLSLGYQSSNLPGFVADQTSAAVETLFDLGNDRTLSTGVNVMNEEWPGESVTQTKFTINYRF